MDIICTDCLVAEKGIKFGKKPLSSLDLAFQWSSYSFNKYLLNACFMKAIVQSMASLYTEQNPKPYLSNSSSLTRLPCTLRPLFCSFNMPSSVLPQCLCTNCLPPLLPVTHAVGLAPSIICLSLNAPPQRSLPWHRSRHVLSHYAISFIAFTAIWNCLYYLLL